MSTQHIGDGSSRDNHYYNLEDEETNRATGRGLNPNAAAWDPEKMELHRIVNQLMALEERRTLAARPVEHPVPHKVKLPGFWEKDVAAWFKLDEVVMEDKHVVDTQVMYRTVLLHIPHHVLERTRGIISLTDTSVDPFTGLENRLVVLLTPSIIDQSTSILRGAELGSRRPTEILEVMMAALPPDEPAGHIFKAIILQRTSRIWWSSSSSSWG